MPKCVTSGEAPLCDVAPRQHNCEETSLRWRHCADLTEPRIKPRISRPNSGAFNHDANRLFKNLMATKLKFIVKLMMRITTLQ